MCFARVPVASCFDVDDGTSDLVVRISLPKPVSGRIKIGSVLPFGAPVSVGPETSETIFLQHRVVRLGVSRHPAPASRHAQVGRIGRNYTQPT